MTGEHEELIVELADGGFAATCLCGWYRPGYRSHEDAEDAWENHCDVVFMEATEADQ